MVRYDLVDREVRLLDHLRAPLTQQPFVADEVENVRHEWDGGHDEECA